MNYSKSNRNSRSWAVWKASGAIGFGLKPELVDCLRVFYGPRILQLAAKWFNSRRRPNAANIGRLINEFQKPVIDVVAIEASERQPFGNSGTGLGNLNCDAMVRMFLEDGVTHDDDGEPFVRPEPRGGLSLC